MTDEQSPGSAPEQESPSSLHEEESSGAAQPETGETRTEKAPALSPEAWGQAARAVTLSFLLGLAFVVFARLVPGSEWTITLLKKNKLAMGDRMSLIYQMIAGGVLFALPPLVLSLSRRFEDFTTEVWERWAWFLSPAILLPAIPVVLRHQVWARKHEDLLPIVLFGAIIAELFFSKAFANVPPLAQRLSQKWFGGDTETADDTAERRAGGKARVEGFVKRHFVLILVVAMALAYGAFMSFYTVRWHHKLGTATFDLGINNNLLYGGLEGKFNQSPVIFPDDPQKYLANHVKLGLYTLLPIYALFPKAETLLVLQSVSLGLGAIPLFLFARRRIPEMWAAALAVAYLVYYPMHGANFYEMKVVPTSAALVLTCIWAIDAKKFVAGGILFVWAMIMREDMPVPLAVVGAVFLLSGHRPKAGLAMAAVATVWFILVRFRFMNEVGSWWFPNMYEDLWASPEKGFRSVIKTLISNPAFTLKHIFVEKKFWYLMHLLVPLAFIPVRRWWAWAALVPGAILTLLVTDYAPPTMFSFQYVMHWAPYLFLAASVVLAQIAQTEGGKAKAKGAVAAMLLASTALSFNYGAFSRRDKALESGYHKIEFSYSKEERALMAEVRKLVASIPVGASVGSTERIGAHLSSRVGFYTLRRGSHGVDYIVARKSGLRLDRTKDTVRKALKSGKYGLVGRYGEFAVFKKGAKTDGNKKIMDEWQLVISKKAKDKAMRSKKRSAARKSGTDRSRKKRAEAKLKAAQQKKAAKDQADPSNADPSKTDPSDADPSDADSKQAPPTPAK